MAACLFIEGRCYYMLNRPEESRKAYADAARLPSARVYDPKQDMFWAPALIASRNAQGPFPRRETLAQPAHFRGLGFVQRR